MALVSPGSLSMAPKMDDDVMAVADKYSTAMLAVLCTLVAAATALQHHRFEKSGM